MSQFHDCAQIPLPSVGVFPTKSILQTVLGWLRNTDRRLGVDIHKADQAFMRKNKSEKKSSNALDRQDRLHSYVP